MKLKDLKAGDKFKRRFCAGDDILMLTDERRVNDYGNTTTMLAVDVKNGQVLRLDHCAEVDKVDEKGEKGGIYYSIIVSGNNVDVVRKYDDRLSVIDTFYSSNNYFGTKEEAERVANEIKVLFKEAHNRQERKNDENSNNSNSSV